MFHSIPHMALISVGFFLQVEIFALDTQNTNTQSPSNITTSIAWDAEGPWTV